jgi:peptide-methionine (S)-S-oxide reductase
MDDESIGEDEAMAQETLVIAGGCFWCVEAVYSELKGVIKAESGYCGGQVPNPSYEQVCAGTTGHAEAVRITYDPKLITAWDILKIFFTVHDPTTLNQQGPDHGTQYRSAIFFKSAEEKALAQKAITFPDVVKIWAPKPIVTTLEPLTIFYVAEAYHQNYFANFTKASYAKKLQMNAGYCQYIIAPKARKEWARLFKK